MGEESYSLLNGFYIIIILLTKNKSLGSFNIFKIKLFNYFFQQRQKSTKQLQQDLNVIFLTSNLATTRGLFAHFSL